MIVCRTSAYPQHVSGTVLALVSVKATGFSFDENVELVRRLSFADDDIPVPETAGRVSKKRAEVADLPRELHRVKDVGHDVGREAGHGRDLRQQLLCDRFLVLGDRFDEGLDASPVHLPQPAGLGLH